MSHDCSVPIHLSPAGVDKVFAVSLGGKYDPKHFCSSPFYFLILQYDISSRSHFQNQNKCMRSKTLHPPPPPHITPSSRGQGLGSVSECKSGGPLVHGSLVAEKHVA